MNNKFKAMFTAAVMCVSALGSAVSGDVGNRAEAASFSYPVQEFRMGISDTNRNISADGSSLNSSLLSGRDNEKWYLNYISAGVYEIVNSATGEIITDNNGKAVLASDTDSANQRWNIAAVEQDFEGFDLYYKITSNADTSKALTFNPNGNSVSLDSYSGAAYQKFKLNLDGLEGFAANAKVDGGEKAGTIGGLLGETVFVNTTEECVEAMKRTEPLTIVVSANLEFGSWSKEDQKIEDNKTIVGSYAANTIYDSQWRNDDFYGSEDKPPINNIVFRNLHFQAKTLTNNCGVILVYIYCGRNIWFDHNDFSATFGHDRDNEVGKFIWINTPVENWSDGCYNSISPDYITISYNHFNNRYWTVAYGTQNTETTRDRTTLMFNKWENCARRTPQIGNGTGHIYNSYHTYAISEPSSQVIAGAGSKILTEKLYFEGLSGLEIEGGGSSDSPVRDNGSVTAGSSSSSPSLLNKSFKYSHSWNPGTENYGYSLISVDNTKSFCNTYAGCFTSVDEIKYITDSDMSSFVETKYESPFLVNIDVSDAKPGAVMNTDVTYVFENVNSGYFLEVAGGIAANGTDVVQDNSGANGWTLKDAGNGYYKIYSELDDGATYLLDLDYGKVDNGTNIGIWGDTNSDAQSFKFVDNGDGSYTIVTKATNDASGVGVTAGSKEKGASVIQWACDGTDNQKWIAKIRINGELIDEVLVNSDAYLDGWRIESGAAVGDPVFPDRDVNYTSIPDAINGAEALLIDCDAKNVNSDLAVLKAAADITLYVGFDKRVEALPEWISGWTATGESAVNGKDVVFNFYMTELNAGDTVTLGTNGRSSGCVNYVVFAAEKAVETTTTTVTTTVTTTTTTTAPIETTTTTTTAEPVDIIFGDADLSGDVELADAVKIMCYIADSDNAPMTAEEIDKADVYQRGDGLSNMDALAVQKYLAQLIPELPESYL